MSDSDQVAPASVFTKVVCGVDGSPAGLEAVRQAHRLAPAGAEMTLVSVCESHLAVHAGASAKQWAQQLNDEAQAALDEARKVVPDADALLLRGRAADVFLRVVGDRGATLVAVGSNEISRASGILVGSVATRALHEAPCSVLLARAADSPWPCSILVGVDGSDGSLAAAGVARDVAARTGAGLRLLAARGAAQDEVATEALMKLGSDLIVSDEKPVPALLEAARDAGLLVLGSRGMTGVRALGSVSERVAHRATCSLLVVR